jgi:hypothetical protein
LDLCLRERAVEVFDFIYQPGESLNPPEEEPVITADAKYLSGWIDRAYKRV